MAEKLMSYSLLDKSNNLNMYKECPYCRLIWVKVDGCDGETTCGEIPA